MFPGAQFPFNQPIVWQPGEKYEQQSQLKRFMDHHGLETLEALMEQPTADPTATNRSSATT